MSGQVIQNVAPIAGVGIAGGLATVGAGLLIGGEAGLFALNPILGGIAAASLAAPLTALGFWGSIEATKDVVNLVKERKQNLDNTKSFGQDNYLLAKYAMKNAKQVQTNIMSNHTILSAKN